MKFCMDVEAHVKNRGRGRDRYRVCKNVLVFVILKIIYSVGQGHVCGRNVFSLVHLHDLRQNRSKKLFKIALEAIKGQLQSAITVRLDKFVFSCNNTVLLWKFHFCLYFEMYQRE